MQQRSGNKIYPTTIEFPNRPYWISTIYLRSCITEHCSPKLYDTLYLWIGDETYLWLNTFMYYMNDRHYIQMKNYFVSRRVHDISYNLLVYLSAFACIDTAIFFYVWYASTPCLLTRSPWNMHTYYQRYRKERMRYKTPFILVKNGILTHSLLGCFNFLSVLN